MSKNMKNFFLPAILSFSILSVFAQNTDSTVLTAPPVVAPKPQETPVSTTPPATVTPAVKTSGAESQAFRFGFKFSPNLAWIKPDTKNFEKDGMQLGFSYGVMGDFRLGDNYAISTELLISTMGGKVIFDSITQAPVNGIEFPPVKNVNYTYKMQYFQLPISLKLKTNEIGYITYWGQFGFAPSVLLKSKADISSTPKVKSNDEDLEDANVNSSKDEYVGFDDNTNFFRVSLIMGLGIEYGLSENTSLMAGLRFDNGFTDVFNDKNTKGINNYLSLNVGVFF
jgi:hypothetical protein